jgi:hypothetical protein
MLGIGSPGELALGEIPASAAAEPTFESKYHQGWSEPVRERIARGLAIALIASGATVPPIAPFPEAVHEAKYHQPWVEPVRARPALPAVEQHVFAFDPGPFTSPLDWLRWLAEPIRVKPGLGAAAQPFEARPAWPDIKVSWFAWWSEPIVKARPRLIEAAQQWLAFNPPFNAGAVQAEWSGPPLSLVRFQYQAFARAPAAPELFALPGGGGWYLPGQTTEERTEDSVVRRRSSVVRPRPVEPQREPPTFAETIAAQRSAPLADVLGACFAAALPTLAPPTLDLYLPARPVASEPAPAISPAAIDDIQDRLDAMAALRVLDEHEQERKAEIVAMLVQMVEVRT